MAEKSKTLIMTSIFRQSRKLEAEDGAAGGVSGSVDAGSGSDLPVSGSGFLVSVGIHL